MNEWLTIEENQIALYRICRETIEKVAPSELSLFEELFPEYLRLAANGEIEVGAIPEGPFGVAGAGELFTLVIIPAASMLLGAILLERGADRVKQLKDARPDEMEQELTRTSNDRSTPKAYRSTKLQPLIQVITKHVTGAN